MDTVHVDHFRDTAINKIDEVVQDLSYMVRILVNVTKLNIMTDDIPDEVDFYNINKKISDIRERVAALSTIQKVLVSERSELKSKA